MTIQHLFIWHFWGLKNANEFTPNNLHWIIIRLFQNLSFYCHFAHLYEDSLALKLINETSTTTWVHQNEANQNSRFGQFDGPGVLGLKQLYLVVDDVICDDNVGSSTTDVWSMSHLSSLTKTIFLNSHGQLCISLLDPLAWPSLTCKTYDDSTWQVVVKSQVLAFFQDHTFWQQWVSLHCTNGYYMAQGRFWFHKWELWASQVDSGRILGGIQSAGKRERRFVRARVRRYKRRYFVHYSVSSRIPKFG